MTRTPSRNWHGLPKHEEPRRGDGRAPHTRRDSAAAPAPHPAAEAALHAARELKTTQGRRQQGRFLLEGVRLVEDALDQGLPFISVFLTPHLLETTTRGAALADRLRRCAWPVFEIGQRLLRLISDTETPPGVLAVAPLPSHLAHLPDPWAPGLNAVLLDQVRDPGNAGAILRTAAAAGLELAVSSEGSVDFFAPKVVRAAAGAHLRLTLAPARPAAELREWFDRWPQVLLADGRARHTLYEVDWRRPSVLILSSEAHGVQPWLDQVPVVRVAIPMSARTESLNVAAAAAVMIYEARRSLFLPHR
jgi:TrmH family RNA methyltransferase